MSSEHTTPVGTPVVMAPGRIVIIGEYASLTEGNAVAAAVGCYAKAQFIPRMEPVSTMVSEIIGRIKAELGDVAAALPPGSVLLTNEDFRRAGSLAAGLGCNAAMAVAAAGAVLETLGLALESRKPQVFRIAEAARRAPHGSEASGADLAASTYGGLIRVSRPRGEPAQVLPIAAPAGLRLVVFSAGPSTPPGDVVCALDRHARRHVVSFRQAVGQLRDAAQRFVDEVASGQATAAVVAAGQYGEILQDLCAAAGAPIVNQAFKQAALLAREFGGIAKPTGSGAGEIGVALFATPEAAHWFRKVCTPPLAALDGDLDPSGVRCEFPDNAVGQDLDESDSAETPAPEPEELAMPTVVTGPPTGMTPSPMGVTPPPMGVTPPPMGVTAPPIEEDAHEAATERTPPPQDPIVVEDVVPAKPRRRRLLVGVLLVLALGLLGWLLAQRWRSEPSSPPPPVKAGVEPGRSRPAVPQPPPPPPPEEAAQVAVPREAEDTAEPTTKPEPEPLRRPPGADAGFAPRVKAARLPTVAPVRFR